MQFLSLEFREQVSSQLFIPLSTFVYLVVISLYEIILIWHLYACCIHIYYFTPIKLWAEWEPGIFTCFLYMCMSSYTYQYDTPSINGQSLLLCIWYIQYLILIYIFVNTFNIRHWFKSEFNMDMWNELIGNKDGVEEQANPTARERLGTGPERKPN